MKKKATILILACFLADEPLAAQWQDGQAALGVIGQADFVSGEKNRNDSDPSNPTARTLYQPQGIAVDSATGKVFVSDSSNQRVLRFGSAEAMGVGVAAEAVFGKPDFTSQLQGTTATSLWLPQGLAVDTGGNLWVADFANNRVVMFENAATRPFIDGVAIPADGVLGQANLTSRDLPATPTASSLNQPAGVVSNASGRVYVADLSNHRVLRFENAAVRAKNAVATGTAVAADGVLGQPGFLSGLANLGGPSPSPAANSLDSPVAVEIGTGGELWVADRGNRRVLRFDSPATQAGASGANADGVLGSLNFTSKGTTGTNLNNPWDIAMDSRGALFVVTEQFHRVVWFDGAAAKGNGVLADGVLGQKDVSVESVSGTNWDASDDSFGTTPTNTGMRFPRAVAISPAGKLWVADYWNNRVIQFNGPGPVFGQPDNRIGKKRAGQKGNNVYNGTGVGQTEKIVAAGKRRTKFFFGIQNDSADADNLTVAATSGNKKIKVKYLQAGAGNVTAGLRRGLALGAVAPGAVRNFTARVVRKTPKRAGRKFTIRSASGATPWKIDVAKAKVKLK